jgi:hypothetical protein
MDRRITTWDRLKVPPTIKIVEYIQFYPIVFDKYDHHESAQPTPSAGYHGDDRWLLVWAALIAKIVATAATAASGAVGGVFTPTIFVGALFGLLVGDLAHVRWPGSSLPIVYAVIGMGTFLAATPPAGAEPRTIEERIARPTGPVSG